MSLRGRFFAAGYDRMLARVEKAGLHAHREWAAYRACCLQVFARQQPIG